VCVCVCVCLFCSSFFVGFDELINNWNYRLTLSSREGMKTTLIFTLY
jgi:hypothetical protein